MARPSLFTRQLADEAATIRLGADLAMVLRRGDVVALVGGLGAGKSTLARAMLRALADDAKLDVPSPTFTLVQTYALPTLEVAHFDLYRLGEARELDDLGFTEALAAGAVLVEWPERAVAAMPDETLVVRLALDADGGRVAEGRGEAAVWRARLDHSFAIRALLDGIDDEAGRAAMAGDAAVNRFERVATAKGPLVVLDWPERAPGPLLADGRTEAAARAIQQRPRAVVAINGLLRRHGFAAPEIVAHSIGERAGVIVMRDLGNAGIAPGGIADPLRYGETVEVLADIAATAFPREIDGPAGRHPVPAFDRTAYAIELALFADWGYRQIFGREPDAGWRTAFEAAWAPLIDRLIAAPQGLALHDVIAPNILYQPGEATPRRRIAFIDTQDAFFGPDGYDLASLVADVRVEVPTALGEALVRRYLDLRPGASREVIASLAAQRLTKIIGGFAMLARRDGRPAHLAYLPRARALLGRWLGEAVLAPVRPLYDGL